MLGNFCCKMYATSHKRSFVPSVGGIRLLCFIYREGNEMSAMVTYCVTHPVRGFCGSFQEL